MSNVSLEAMHCCALRGPCQAGAAVENFRETDPSYFPSMLPYHMGAFCTFIAEIFLLCVFFAGFYVQTEQ